MAELRRFGLRSDGHAPQGAGTRTIMNTFISWPNVSAPALRAVHDLPVAHGTTPTEKKCIHGGGPRNRRAVDTTL